MPEELVNCGLGLGLVVGLILNTFRSMGSTQGQGSGWQKCSHLGVDHDVTVDVLARNVGGGLYCIPTAKG